MKKSTKSDGNYWFCNECLRDYDHKDEADKCFDSHDDEK
jgi:hypothetical protein